MMIRPAAFAANPLTAASNSFQQGVSEPHGGAAHTAALAEFDRLVGRLREAGVTVEVLADTREPHKPDAIFPNNWISTHADGTVVLYPMMAPNRRLERRPELVDALVRTGYVVRERVDLSGSEASGRFLEGTGSMVLDRVNRIAYACLSPRTDRDELARFGRRLGYEVLAFDALDGQGTPIYHTNVMMSVFERLAVICDASIPDAAVRERVCGRLVETGHELVRITPQQMTAFAGNVLQLARADGGRCIAMSVRAREAFTPAQRARLEEAGPVVASDIATIEDSAGGGVRCMIAELHLPSDKRQ